MTEFDRSAITDDLIRDAYRYLLARFLVIRQEHMDRAADGFAYNRIVYNPLGSADFVNPNLDVAYLEAWFAVDDDTAVLFEVPQIEGRYYTAQLIDEWGEVIANINERATPTKPFGSFALVKPGSTPQIPRGATRLELHGAKAKLLARVELKGDPDGAVDLQRRFRAEPLGDVRIDDPPAIPSFDNQTLLGVEIFECADEVLASALDVSPVATRWQLAARAIGDVVASDPAERARIDRHLRDVVVPEFQRWALTEAAPYVDNWIGGSRIGNYGEDYGLRTMADYVGIWANTSEEVVYFVATRDADGAVLDGSDHYVLRFEADRLPDAAVDGYWSVILVSVPDYRVVPNPLNRFNLNQYSPLVRGDDGSLTIAVGPTPGDAPESNWLPSPAGQPFSLTLRCYVPRDARPFGTWGPPGVTRIA